MSVESENQELMREARLLALAAPVILPLLAKKKKIAMEMLLQKHREGSSNYVAHIATLDVLTELEREIHNKEQMIQQIGG